MGAVNLIWQRDALDYIIRSLALAASPPALLNVAGPEVVSVRRLARMIGSELGAKPQFISNEAPTALLSDASRCIGMFGPPSTSVEQMVSTIARWVADGGKTLGKPTKYDVRDGTF